MSKIAVIAFTALSSSGSSEGSSMPQLPDAAFSANKLVIQMVVKCPGRLLEDPGFGIISYSRIEKLYCTPNSGCFSSAKTAINQMCS